MSSEPHEIVIIKRHRGGHEDEHHGGVWKIAFADFMTAMMAFFLVMWLISANDKTKAVIARYFNPVQLVDSTPQPKGLEDPKPDSPSVMPKSAAPASQPKGGSHADTKTDDTGGGAKSTDTAKGEAKNEGHSIDNKAMPASRDAGASKAMPNAPAEAILTEKRDEAALFRDPYAVLAEIAGKSMSQPSRDAAKAASEGNKGGSGAIGRKGGEAYRDPFEPQPVRGGPTVESLSQDNKTEALDQAAPTAPTAAVPPPSQPDATGRSGNAAAAAAMGVALDADAAEADAAQPNKPAAPANKAAITAAPLAASGSPATDAKAAAAAAAALVSNIKDAVAQSAAANPGGSPTLDIRQTADGTVIDLTDGADFSMFASASARPDAQTVALLGKIGRLLKDQKGLVTVRGYTDARPFRSDTYDNWRLSAARAHMAHYMLVRGGFDEARIERIEGYADHQLKNPKDPGGAENRRIEILLRNPAP